MQANLGLMVEDGASCCSVVSAEGVEEKGLVQQGQKIQMLHLFPSLWNPNTTVGLLRIALVVQPSFACN